MPYCLLPLFGSGLIIFWSIWIESLFFKFVYACWGWVGFPLGSFNQCSPLVSGIVICTSVHKFLTTRSPCKRCTFNSGMCVHRHTCTTHTLLISLGGPCQNIIVTAPHTQVKQGNASPICFPNSWYIIHSVTPSPANNHTDSLAYHYTSIPLSGPQVHPLGVQREPR